MGAIGLIFLIATVCLLAIGVLMVKYAEFMVSNIVDRKHHAADSIILTRAIPNSWSRGVRWLSFVPILGKRRVAGRLNTIIRYFKRTPLVEDEDTRKAIIGELESVREEWMGLSLQEIPMQESD